MAHRQRFRDLLSSAQPMYEEYIRHNERNDMIDVMAQGQPDEELSRNILANHLRQILTTLQELEEHLRNYQGSFSKDYNYKLDSMLTVVYLHMARIHSHPNLYDPEVQTSDIFDLAKSEEYLNKVLEFHKKHGVDRETVIPTMKGLVCLAKIYDVQRKFNEAIDCLTEAEKVGIEYRRTNRTPVGYAARFEVEDPNELQPRMLLDAIQSEGIYNVVHIFTLEGTPADVRKRAWKQANSSINAMTKRLYPENIKNYEEIIKMKLMMAVYFRKTRNYPHARYQLLSATVIVHYMVVISTNAFEITKIIDYSAYNHSIPIQRIKIFDEFVQYGISLLVLSKMRVEMDAAAAGNGAEQAGINEDSDLDLREYPKLQGKVLKGFEEIPADLITNYQKARSLFNCFAFWIARILLEENCNFKNVPGLKCYSLHTFAYYYSESCDIAIGYAQTDNSKRLLYIDVIAILQKILLMAEKPKKLENLRDKQKPKSEYVLILELLMAQRKRLQTLDSKGKKNKTEQDSDQLKMHHDENLHDDKNGEKELDLNLGDMKLEEQTR